MEKSCPICVEKKIVECRTEFDEKGNYITNYSYKVENFYRDYSMFNIFLEHIEKNLLGEYHDYTKIFYRLIGCITLEKLIEIEEISDINKFIKKDKNMAEHLTYEDEECTYANLDYLIEKEYISFEDIGFFEETFCISPKRIEFYEKHNRNIREILENLLDEISSPKIDCLLLIGNKIEYNETDYLKIIRNLIYKDADIDEIIRFMKEFNIDRNYLKIAITEYFEDSYFKKVIHVCNNYGIEFNGTYFFDK